MVCGSALFRLNSTHSVSLGSTRSRSTRAMSSAAFIGGPSCLVETASRAAQAKSSWTGKTSFGSLCVRELVLGVCHLVHFCDVRLFGVEFVGEVRGGLADVDLSG